MTDSITPAAGPDTIDAAAGLREGDAVAALRRARDKVLLPTQLSEAALFDPALPDLSLVERLHAARYVAQRSNAHALASAYRTRLLDAADTRDPKLRARAQAAALIVAALAQPPGPTLRARLAAMSTPEGRSPAGRNQALIAAAADKRIGEAALLALWISAETGPSGLAIADRARIVGALADVGLAADARAFALEGLLALK